MPTARELIISAYRDSGLRAPTENPTAQDAEVGLELLNNDLIPYLRINQDYPSSVKVYVFNTIPNHSLTYTIGVNDVTTNPPDWAVQQEIVRIDWAQVNIGGTWRPLRQISATDYYRMDQPNTAVVPVQFAFNRTHDPYDQFILAYQSPGDYQIRLACNGIVNNYDLNDEVNLPSGYYVVLKYGLASLLCQANGLFDSQARMEKRFNDCLKAVENVNRAQPPKLKVQPVLARYNIFTDQVMYSNNGGI